MLDTLKMLPFHLVRLTCYWLTKLKPCKHNPIRVSLQYDRCTHCLKLIKRGNIMINTTRFNKDNQSYLNKSPLFLGEPLGLTDTINVTYPELDELYEEQSSQYWREQDVDITQDKMDMLNVDPSTTDLMIKTISWQHLADSVANRSISTSIGKYITNTELELLVGIWTYFEGIHTRAYSHIVKNTFQDPNQMLQETYNNIQVLNRSQVIVDAFDAMDEIDANTPRERVMELIIVAFTALFALEAIAFMSSFAITFGIVENTQKFQGIGNLVKLICRDEVLHTRMDFTILDILVRKEDNQVVLQKVMPECKAILDAVVEQELVWTDYLFSEGRSCLGLSAELVKEYVKYMSVPVYAVFGLELPYSAPTENPLPYMEDYVDSSKFQSAAQEINLTNYNTNAMLDDSSELDSMDWDEVA
jgi:ribonucleoside-diphosphate reductase beta chain